MPDINSVTGDGRFSDGGCLASQVRLVGYRPAPVSMTSFTAAPVEHELVSRNARVSFHCVEPEASRIASASRCTAGTPSTLDTTAPTGASAGAAWQ